MATGLKETGIELKVIKTVSTVIKILSSVKETTSLETKTLPLETKILSLVQEMKHVVIKTLLEEITTKSMETEIKS